MVLTKETRFDPITLEILWTRLIAIADETATILKRTSFSPTVRESNDYSCVLFDENGDTVAENTIGIPSFNGVMSRALKIILQQYPQELWQAGDVVITNDPWIASGHLLDITCVIPIFYEHKLVGFSGSIAHMADMGGNIWSADSHEVYEEGIRIPPLFLYKQGIANADLIALIRNNVRVPDEVLGDIHAQIAAGRTGAHLLIELLDENQIDCISPISSIIQEKAEQAMRRAVSAIPDGEYKHTMETDGFGGEPVIIKVAVTVSGDEMTIDFTGSSAQISHAINVPFNYTHAYTCFPVKCAIDPLTPRNEGSYRPLHVIAPVGSILNPQFPAPVNGRHLVGHFLSCAVYGALAQAIPEQIIADSGSAPQQYTIFTGSWRGHTFSTVLTICGGMGARPTDDGLSCTSFPSNVSVGSMEIIEAVSPMIIWKKELLQDSGGGGKYRGGLGQVIELEVRGDGPIQMSLMFDRVEHPATGTTGGLEGGAADVLINGQQSAYLKGRDNVQPGDRIRLQYSGGGGFGSPEEREPGKVAEDLRNELISEEAASRVYQYKG
ncbi:hydantoinase B/oxoprolinase family protein [Paenibacillus eucommiae]|uniref:N-methylhydantoinase B n=1 Tax=Paenibacillus eucommiae TaxID=1355755 RepID=A0ABS4J5H9_9BACL|nr:hydantoinase B/oxoprolinase family protein [Paenibacillus eucommiae]MBP1995106.1 N-methylhydantoinase B [Paenibacillus eucommiae]